MNKKTQMWIGVGVVAVAGYFLWKKSQSATKSFATSFQPRCTSDAQCQGLGYNKCAGASGGKKGYCVNQRGTISSAPF